MNVIVTGGCGFVGSSLCLYLKNKIKKIKILSLDNLSKEYSRRNQKILKKNNIENKIINVGNFNQMKNIKFKADVIIDCSANPSVEASKRNMTKIIESNFLSTVNILEKTSHDKSKLIFLSSSRVYPINDSYARFKKYLNTGKVSSYDENDNTDGPKTMYGFTKFSSEELIKEYKYSNNIDYIINRCGLISGPGQFGKVEQGLVSLWMWKHINNSKLKFIGHKGSGKQIRDVLFIEDLCRLILIQIKEFNNLKNNLFCIGGGKKNIIDLVKLTEICSKISKKNIIISKVKKTSNYDIPYYVSSIDKINKFSGWKPKKNLIEGLKELFEWMTKNKKQISRYFQ